MFKYFPHTEEDLQVMMEKVGPTSIRYSMKRP
jgi:hypothetical protein